jgi:hypothetical protein
MKRHSNALAIQQGACNPSGIALSIVDACREIRESAPNLGTAGITGDAAVRLMVHQLAFLCAAHAVDTEYSALMAECEIKKGN